LLAVVLARRDQFTGPRFQTMPAPRSHTADYPTAGFRTVTLAGAPGRTVSVYLPTDYQPKYAYPVVVLFHADGASADGAARLVPLLSARNYIVLCVRGAARRAPRADGRPAFGWSGSDARAVRAALAHAAARYNTNPARVFFVGTGAGATAAVRCAKALPGVAAGVAALDGDLPALRGRAPFALLATRADRDAVRKYRAAGATVTRARASSAPAELLREANRWIMAQVAG
jgi:phospholipase/carboxylesterase